MLEPIPWNYHIYVSNQTEGVKQIFVRVRGDKLQEHEIYSRILNERSVELSGEAKTGAKVSIKESNKHEKENKERQVFSCLTQGGFNLLQPGGALPFAVENADRSMYVSVHDGNMMWDTDMAVNPKTYGCVTIKGDRKGISLRLTNPEPRWVECKKTDRSFPSGMVKVHHRPDNVPVYMAKVILSVGGRVGFDWLTGVWREHGKLCNGGDPIGTPAEATKELNVLLATGYEWVKAERGNAIPPNAAKASIGRQHVYVGRINGDTACCISELDRMFNCFATLDNRSSTGEVLLLTSEPSARP